MSSSDCFNSQRLYAYSVGKMSAAEAEQLERHLDGCPACTSAMAALDDGDDALRIAMKDPVAKETFEHEQAYRLGWQAAEQLLQGTEAAPHAKPPAPDHPPEIRDYRLLGKLGEGGMGVVYQAVHTRLERVVALKLISTNRMGDPELVARFGQEMKAVGGLNHPNIVQATDAGEADGIPYLVTEYIEGADLAWIVQHRGPLRSSDTCEIIRRAAAALQHAYEHDLVHRDIKPANLMLARDGQVKLLDLGLAHLGCRLGNRELTSPGQVMGTADYMAPEQFSDTGKVDIRADIYGLGCTMIYLLTGAPPFASQAGTTLLEKLKAHAEFSPPSLTALRSDVPQTLEAVVHKALAKKPSQRFATPEGLSKALAPFAGGSDLVRLGEKSSQARAASKENSSLIDTDPITGDARTLKTPARFRRPFAASWWSRGTPRRRVRVAAAALLASGALLATLIYFNTGKGQLVLQVHQDGVELRIDGAQVRIDTPRHHLHVAAGAHELEVSKDGFVTQTHRFRIYRHGKVALDAQLKPLPETKPDGAAKEQETSLAGHEVFRVLAHRGGVSTMALTPDGRWLLSGGNDGYVRCWDVQTGEGRISQYEEMLSHQGKVLSVQISSEGRFGLSGGDDHAVRLWNLLDGSVVRQYTGHTAAAMCAAFAPQEKGFATGSQDASVILWEHQTSTPTAVLGYQGGEQAPRVDKMTDLKSLEGHVTWVRAVAYSQDGKQLVSGGNECLVAVWDLTTKTIQHHLIGHRAPVTAVAFTPDARRIITAAYDNTIRVWDSRQGKLLKTIEGHVGPVLQVQVDNSGAWLASASADATVALWDLESGDELIRFRGHRGAVHAVAILPAARNVLSGGEDETIRMWAVPDALLPEVAQRRPADPTNSMNH